MRARIATQSPSSPRDHRAPTRTRSRSRRRGCNRVAGAASRSRQASSPARPGPRSLVPINPSAPGGGSQIRSDPSTPGLGGARSVSEVARVQARQVPGGAGLGWSGRPGRVSPGRPRRARSHLPCPALQRRPACSPTAGRGRHGAPDAPCRAPSSRPDRCSAPARRLGVPLPPAAGAQLLHLQLPVLNGS